MPDDEDSAEKFRIDRVYIPAKPPQRRQGSPPPYNRGRTSTPPPESSSDVELALRRQLSRLQRQLAEAQSELANKDDELAAELANRKNARETYEQLLDEQRQKGELLAEVVAAQVRVTELGQESHRHKTTVEELTRTLDREKSLRLAASGRIDELNEALEDAHVRAKEERAKLDSQRLVEVSALEHQVRLALEAAQNAATQAAARVAEAHASEIGELRGAQERALAAIRGELEPKAVEARELAAERERIAGEIAQVKLEAARDLSERTEAHARDKAGIVEAHAREIAQMESGQERERARFEAELEAAKSAQQQAVSTSDLREKELDHQLSALRDVHTRIENELATMKVRCAWLESEKADAEHRHAAAVRVHDTHNDEMRGLRDQIDAKDAELKRGAVERQRFVAYLEQGLALVGALPPTEPKA